MKDANRKAMFARMYNRKNKIIKRRNEVKENDVYIYKNHYKEIYKNLRKAGYSEEDSYSWILKALHQRTEGSTVGKRLNELIRESSKERRIY